MTKRYTIENFEFIATPMTKLEYAQKHNEYVPDYTTQCDWNYWEGFEIDWHGFKFWKDAKSFYEIAKQAKIKKKRSAVVVKIQEYTVDDISQFCEDDWTDEECIDCLEEIVREWEPCDSEVTSNCKEHTQITIINN